MMPPNCRLLIFTYLRRDTLLFTMLLTGCIPLFGGRWLSRRHGLLVRVGGDDGVMLCGPFTHSRAAGVVAMVCLILLRSLPKSTAWD